MRREFYLGPDESYSFDPPIKATLLRELRCPDGRRGLIVELERPLEWKGVSYDTALLNSRADEAYVSLDYGWPAIMNVGVYTLGDLRDMEIFADYSGFIFLDIAGMYPTFDDAKKMTWNR